MSEDERKSANKWRRNRGLPAIKAPFVSIDPKGLHIISEEACKLLNLKAGDFIEWDNGPKKAESGMKLSRHLRGLRFKSARLAFIYKAETRKRIYLNKAA